MTTRSSRLVPFRPPARRRLHEDVAEQLRDAILDGRYLPGDKLPPERELAQQLGVGRAAIREALRATGGNRVQAARRLGIARATLYQKLAEFPELAGTTADRVS